MGESRLMSFQKLEQLVAVGLTDRQLRNIAKAGYFPAPVDGQYDWVATVRGLLKYFREQKETLAKRKEKIADEQHRRFKRENDLAEGELLRKADVVSEFRKVLDPIKQTLRQKLENEYPPAVASMDVPQARVFGKRLGDDILIAWGKFFLRFGI